MLTGLGFETDRLKTGTPARVDSRTVNYVNLEAQPGDPDVKWFSFDRSVSTPPSSKSDVLGASVGCQASAEGRSALPAPKTTASLETQGRGLVSDGPALAILSVLPLERCTCASCKPQWLLQNTALCLRNSMSGSTALR